jgi:hypothetical protein
MILTIYERNKEHTIKINDFTLRAKIWDFFSNIRTVISMSLGLNYILLNQPDNVWAKDQVQRQVNKIKELASDAQALLEKLR